MITTVGWAPDLSLAKTKAYDLMFVAWSCGLTVVSLAHFGWRTTLEGFLLAVFGLGIVLAGAAVIGVAMGGSEGRAAVFGGGPNVYGRNMGLLALAALSFVSDGRRWLRRPGLVVAPLAVLLVFLSGSRGAMLALFVGLFVFLFLRRWDRRVVRSMMLVVLIGLVALATQVGRFAVVMFQERFVVQLLMERYFTNRDTLLLDGVTAGVQHPVGGLGLAGFAQLGSKGTYPHNMFVEAFVEGGAIGLVVLSIPFLFYIRRWRHGMGAGDAIAVAMLALLVVSSSISGDLFDARGVFLLLLVTLASQDGGGLRTGGPSRRPIQGVP